MRKRTAGGGTKERKKYQRDTLEEEEELQQVNPYHDAQLEFLKASIDKRRFGDIVGAHPFSPVLLKPGHRRFRGNVLPHYYKGNDVNTVPPEYIYMGIAMQPSKTDNALHDALGMICIPTIVSGLATMFVRPDFKLSPGSKIFWPKYDPSPNEECVYLGRFIERINDRQIRIKVENIGENLRSAITTPTGPASGPAASVTP